MILNSNLCITSVSSHKPGITCVGRRRPLGQHKVVVGLLVDRHLCHIELRLLLRRGQRHLYLSAWLLVQHLWETFQLIFHHLSFLRRCPYCVL